MEFRIKKTVISNRIVVTDKDQYISETMRRLNSTQKVEEMKVDLEVLYVYIRAIRREL